MLIKPLFSDFFAREKLDLNNDEIVNYCYELEKTQMVSEKGLPIRLKMNERPLHPLYLKVREKFNEVHNKLSLSKDMYQELINGWININHAISPQEPHAHDDFPGVMFTAVYYPKTEENCSNLNFINSNPARKFVMFQNFIGNYNEFNSSEWWITPETGDLVIFPAWLFHYVSVNKSKVNEQRISIAFNSKISVKRM